MALGEVLGEAYGKVARLKALGNGKIEVSLQGKGQYLSSDMDDVVTFWSVMKPNGTQHIVKELQFICLLMVRLKGAALELVNAWEPGSWKYVYGGAYTNATSEKWQRLFE